ncbi:MAG: hypothetical protein ACMUHU_07270 [Thermoplasmatota archaeon]
MSRKTFVRIVSIALVLLSIAVTGSVAAQADDPSAGGGGAVAVMCLLYACFTFLPFIVILILAIWVHSDAKNNGVDNAFLWAVVVFFTGIVGLIIYFLVIKPKALEDRAKRSQRVQTYGTGMTDMPRKDGYCNHCGKFVGATVGRCTFCGSDL